MPPVGKIARLPEDIRKWLHDTFVERSFGDIVAVTEDLNALMKQGGVAITIGKSAVGNEALKVKRAQEAIAATTRHMQLLADSAKDDADKRGEALNAMVSTELFEALICAREAEVEPDVDKRLGLMNKAALAAARLTTSSVRQRKFRSEVEDRAKAAADKVAKIVKKGGMDAQTAAEIRSQILGIVKREPPAEPRASS